MSSCGGNTTVTDGKCACQDGYVIALNNQFCIRDSECADLNGAVSNGQCECTEGYRLNSDRTRCVADGQCGVLEELSND